MSQATKIDDKELKSAPSAYDLSWIHYLKSSLGSTLIVKLK